MPTYRFDKRFCLSVAEFEFPAYFNFFVKRRKIILVCDKEGEKAVRTIFQETLLGPVDLSEFEQDFVIDYKAKPDIIKELKHFAKNPFNPIEPLTVDTLITFVIYENDVADLGQNIIIKKESQKISIFDNDKLIARIKDKADIMIDSDNINEYVKYGMFTNPTLEKQSSTQFVERYIEQQFTPPVFGITILGCSHGFDPKGSTSGYIIWVNGRGIMVDPPPYSTLLLKKMGIPTTFVKWIYVSHTHADHDAGTFQKILESEKIELITSRTIMESFVRKYAAMTGFQADYIKTLFNFRPAVVGHILRINGAEIKVHYSLHSIPCLGFTVKLLDKSIYFSGDTFYDPDGLKKMLENGVLTQERYNDLMSPEKWNNTLILHEAGVPPIHTPSKILAQLPEDVKTRIRLCHVAAKDVAPDSGLQISQTGLENTIVLIKETENEKLRIIRSLNLIQNIHLFQKASFKHIRDIFEVVYEKTYKKNEFICKEGEKGDEFYIIRKGSVMIQSEKSDHSFVRYLYEGDYFGEACFFDKFLRTANAISMTDDTSLLILQKDDFLFIFANKEEINNPQNKGSEQKSIMDKLMVLQESRNKSLSLIGKNKFFSQLSSSQKQEFQIMMPKPKFFKKGSQIWTTGVHAEFVVMVLSGLVRVSIEGNVKVQQENMNSPVKIQKSQLNKTKQRRSVPVVPIQGIQQQLKARSKETEEKRTIRDIKVYTLGEGIFIGEVEAIMSGKKLQTNLDAIEDSQLVLIQGDSFNSFLSSNPGLQVLFRDSLIIE